MHMPIRGSISLQQIGRVHHHVRVSRADELMGCGGGLLDLHRGPDAQGERRLRSGRSRIAGDDAEVGIADLGAVLVRTASVRRKCDAFGAQGVQREVLALEGKLLAFSVGVSDQIGPDANHVDGGARRAELCAAERIGLPGVDVVAGDQGDEQSDEAEGPHKTRYRQNGWATLGYARGGFAPMTDERVSPGADELAPLVYDELRRLAAVYMRRERPGQTLQATALVHEAYLRLAGPNTPWNDRRHFIGIAARAMRQILVERSRARGAAKRWGALDRVSLHESLAGAAAPDDVLPALDEALEQLEKIDPEQARIVELRFFAGLTVEETADVLGLSPATVKRRWSLARAWLFRELSTRER